MAFHAKEGWHFERREDGSVEITRRLPIATWAGSQTEGWPVEYVRLDADTWASVVASVCAAGENGQTFAAAAALHAGAGPFTAAADLAEAIQDRRDLG